LRDPARQRIDAHEPPHDLAIGPTPRIRQSANRGETLTTFLP